MNCLGNKSTYLYIEQNFTVHGSGELIADGNGANAFRGSGEQDIALLEGEIGGDMGYHGFQGKSHKRVSPCCTHVPFLFNSNWKACLSCSF